MMGNYLRIDSGKSFEPNCKNTQADLSEGSDDAIPCIVNSSGTPSENIKRMNLAKSQESVKTMQKINMFKNYEDPFSSPVIAKQISRKGSQE